MHYGPTRIIGPTGHAFGGTAQLALRNSSTALGCPTISYCYGPDGAAGGWTPPLPPPKCTQESQAAAGRPEQLVDVGRSDPALCGLNNHATTGSGPTRQTDIRKIAIAPARTDAARRPLQAPPAAAARVRGGGRRPARTSAAAAPLGAPCPRAAGGVRRIRHMVNTRGGPAALLRKRNGDGGLGYAAPASFAAVWALATRSSLRVANPFPLLHSG